MGIFDFFKRIKNNSSESELLNEEMDEVVEFIKQEIKFGFDYPEEILESVWAFGFENEDKLDEKWLNETIKKYYNRHLKESEKWKRPTDFDKLAQIFDELNQEKIIALHKAGYTKQDGYDDVNEVVNLLQAKNIKPKGFCFYHIQDLERVIVSGSLFLAFDDIKQNTENAILLGKKIVAKLEKNNFLVEWNETVEQRIEIKDLLWQKIPDKQPWGITRAIKFLHKSIE